MKDEWPASSPDLNPLDYAIWSILEAQVNAEAHNSVESLKQAITEAFENLDQGMINRAIDDWPRRLDAVIASNGGHFEWICLFLMLQIVLVTFWCYSLILIKSFNSIPVAWGLIRGK